MTSRLPVRIVSGFWAAAFAITLLGAWSISALGVVRPVYDGPYRAWPALLNVWTRFDAAWYQSIVTNGYFYRPTQESSIVFFPAYPLALKPFVALGINPYLAGFFVTLVASSVAIVAFMGWQRDYRYAPGVAAPTQRAIVVATLAWLVYPYAYYLYGSLYSDALFVAVAIGAFWLLERGHPLAAGIVGIVATAGRPFGWAVTVGLAVRVVERRWFEAHGERLTLADVVHRPRAVVGCVTPVDLTVGVSGLGVLAWLSYLWIRFGSPWVFIRGEDAWGQGAGGSVLLKSLFWDSVLHNWSTSPLGVVTLIAQAIIGIGLLTVGTWVAVRRFGPGIALYVLFTILPPVLFSKDFQGIGRYALSAFPVFAVLGTRLSPHLRIARLGLAGSALTMVFLASMYARGFYLS